MKRSVRSGVAIAARIALLSVMTIARGVLAGAAMPYQLLAEYPGIPASIIVGNSGATLDLCTLVTASARILPAFACCNAAGIVGMLACTWPDMTSVIAAAMPL